MESAQRGRRCCVALGRRHRRAGVVADRADPVVEHLEESPDLDSPSLEALEDFLTAQEARGLRLLLARLKPASMALLERVMPTRLASATFTDLSVDDAVAKALHALEAAPQ